MLWPCSRMCWRHGTSCNSHGMLVWCAHACCCHCLVRCSLHGWAAMPAWPTASFLRVYVSSVLPSTAFRQPHVFVSRLALQVSSARSQLVAEVLGSWAGAPKAARDDFEKYIRGEAQPHAAVLLKPTSAALRCCGAASATQVCPTLLL